MRKKAVKESRKFKLKLPMTMEENELCSKESGLRN